MKQFWAEVLDVCQITTGEIGRQLMADFGKLKASQKSDGSLVTSADRWADKQITQAINHNFASHGVLSEETQHTLTDTDWCWVIDPIDGTTNFTRGLPIWAISLGLLYRGVPVFGYVYVPPLHHAFYGYWYGNTGLTGPQGAFLNGEPIHTSLDAPSRSQLFNLCARSTEVLKKPFPCKIRMIGVASYNLLLVAAGATVGGVEATPKIWDIAAAYPIVKAAGGEFVLLESEAQFPLQAGKNYRDCSFPSLAVNQAQFVSTFKPLVRVILPHKI